MVYTNLSWMDKEMCGRFAQRSDPKRLAKEFKVAEVPQVEARYNIAPTQEILAVRELPDGREIAFLKWGSCLPGRRTY